VYTVHGEEVKIFIWLLVVSFSSAVGSFR
jgi:hypothetical protein